MNNLTKQKALVTGAIAITIAPGVRRFQRYKPTSIFSQMNALPYKYSYFSFTPKTLFTPVFAASRYPRRKKHPFGAITYSAVA